MCKLYQLSYYALVEITEGARDHNKLQKKCVSILSRETTLLQQGFMQLAALIRVLLSEQTQNTSQREQ